MDKHKLTTVNLDSKVPHLEKISLSIETKLCITNQYSGDSTHRKLKQYIAIQVVKISVNVPETFSL